MAHLTGNTLQEISLNTATDATDLLGTYEEVDTRGRVTAALRSLVSSLEQTSASLKGSQATIISDLIDAVRTLLAGWSDKLFTVVLENLAELDSAIGLLSTSLRSSLQSVLTVSHGAYKFEWVDGPLVRALKAGHWVLLDGANLCSPSVLDRLNALCESNGVLNLHERGVVHGEVETITPHPNFRLFMCVDTHFGELSRAMRNRGVEIALVNLPTAEDDKRITDFIRIPSSPHQTVANLHDVSRYAFLSRSGTVATHEEPILSQLPASTRLLQEDSNSSAMLDLLLSLQRSSAEAEVYAATYSVQPSQIFLSLRFIRSSPSALARWSHVLSSFEALPGSRALEIAMRFRAVHRLELALPNEILRSQVSFT